MPIRSRSMFLLAVPVLMTLTPGPVAALTLPAIPGLVASAPIDTVQYRPGAAQTREYRRAMRHYQNRPGAQFQLRRNRTVYCRNQPSRC